MPYYVQLTPDVVIALSALSSTEHTAKLDAACRDFVVIGGLHAPPIRSAALDTHDPAATFSTQPSLI
ncbi:hypothetical protein [Burkholderia ubonensis]|uniref:hypothetical protein n=1 Tax=Burkholderia ubonensis TaxID=101571 RepID=UPI000751DF8C|nr:hypothetical protein [Burkholderia ubonensis]KVV07392.1 hypothetical protein WK77_16525 [Burkholderia ubonensis]